MSDEQSNNDQGDGNAGERRRHRRVTGALGIDLLAYEGSDGVAPDSLTDISRGGLRLLTTAPEQPGARVTVRIGLSAGDAVQHELAGQVVWARQAAPFQVGIRFTELTADARELLTRVAPPAA